MEGNPPASS
uniref:Uncharacterized protein n=1 Tax=Arundo donax TaxID=35708 RepID=A0A0A9G9H0_ARUDO